jgi:predicted branched-subunit amino acid permease
MALPWTAWYVIGVLAIGVGIMARDIIGTDFAMFGMLIAIMIPGERVVEVKSALEGFSNEGLLTVASTSHCEVLRRNSHAAALSRGS